MTRNSQVQAPFAFAGSGLDRAAGLRRETETLADMAARGSSRFVLFWQGRPAFDANGGLVMVGAGHPALSQAPGTPIFLGRDGDVHLFAADLRDWVPEGPHPDGTVFFDATEQVHPDLPAGSVFAELRGRMVTLTPREAELAATARALFTWHLTHRFCARCGTESEMRDAGWMRLCPSCGGQHFPRTDPVVIMLVTHGNRALLGRSPAWPEGMYSCLAGFMEPGESLEDAVRREVVEETGVSVGEVRFVASQPWPFPASLMFGCEGRATSEAITIDPAEIEDALWVNRERLAGIFAGSDPDIRPPRKGAIAGWLLREWLADRLK